MIEIREEQERVILFGVSGSSGNVGGEERMKESLDELEELVATAGGVTLAKVIQNLENPNPGTYLKGKNRKIWKWQENFRRREWSVTTSCLRLTASESGTGTGDQGYGPDIDYSGYLCVQGHVQ